MEHLVSGSPHHLGGNGHIHPDISMTTIPRDSTQSKEEEQYYGDFNSHVDGQQYTESSHSSNNTEELINEDELTD